MITKATYVSVWDDGIEVKTSCQFNTETKEVTDIEQVDVTGLDILDREYVLLPDGTEVEDFIAEGNEAESLTSDEIARLRNIVK